MNRYKKLYKIGMYGGKFLPFHKGHNYCVEVAVKECETVYVILFAGGADEERIMNSRSDEWLSVEERVKQLNLICERASEHAKVIPVVIDTTTLRTPEGEEDWDAETPLVREVLGPVLDAVYSSEESYGEYFSRAYPEAVHRLVDVKRINYPISATKIRNMSDKEERKLWII